MLPFPASATAWRQSSPVAAIMGVAFGGLAAGGIHRLPAAGAGGL